jgi:hypothetical protein
LVEESDDDQQNEPIKRFQSALDRHGHAFPQAIVALAGRLFETSSTWSWEATEVPVELRGDDTSIDILFKRYIRHYYEGILLYYMVAECKRVNPALSDWLFVRSRYVQKTAVPNRVILQSLFLDDRGNAQLQIRPQYPGERYAAFHTALEVRNHSARGDIGGGGRSAIEDAATQVLRGLNGMIGTLLIPNPDLFHPSHTVALLPVIFTTARLWVSEVDLSTAALETGTVDLGQAGVSQKDWLFYEYNMSPGLTYFRQAYVETTADRNISQIMEREYVRTIAVVSASGIEDFLTSTSRFLS